MTEDGMTLIERIEEADGGLVHDLLAVAAEHAACAGTRRPGFHPDPRASQTLCERRTRTPLPPTCAHRPLHDFATDVISKRDT